jgi:hypothetical protein
MKTILSFTLLLSLGQVFAQEIVLEKEEVLLQKLELTERELIVPRTLPREQTVERLNQVILLGDKGNGGDAVVCRNEYNKVTKAEILDHYEARVLHEKKIERHKELGLAGYINLVTNRLADCDSRTYKNAPKEAAKLVSAIETYRKSGEREHGQVVFVNVPLSDVRDSKHDLDLDPSCNVEQLVVRTNSNGDYPFEYVIQLEIFNELQASGVQGIVLHEVIYKLKEKASGDKTSLKTRALVQRIASMKLSEILSAKFCRSL